MKARTLGVCLIGCGRAGMIHARNFMNKVPGAHMTAVVDVSEEAARAAAAQLQIDRYFTDYHEILDDPAVDAVVVVAPTDLHQEIVVACAGHAKHVFCEKPMAMNAAQCQSMIDACEKGGVKLQIGFMRRHDRSFQRAKAMLDEGLIGDLVLVKSHTRGPSKPRPWMYDLKQSNGILAEISSHDIDAIRWYAGSDIDSLYAVGGNYRNPEATAQYPDYYDNVTMTGVCKNGVQFMLDGAAYVQYGYDSHVELVGTKGVMHVGHDEEHFVHCATPANGTVTPFVKSWIDLFEDAYLREDIAFVQAIQNGVQTPVTGYDGMMVARVVEAGNRSIASGQAIKL